MYTHARLIMVSVWKYRENGGRQDDISVSQWVRKHIHHSIDIMGASTELERREIHNQRFVLFIDIGM